MRRYATTGLFLAGCASPPATPILSPEAPTETSGVEILVDGLPPSPEGRVEWRVDDALVHEGPRLEGSHYDKGQQIQATLIPPDQAPQSSPPVVAVDSPPRITELSLQPDPPRPGEPVQLIVGIEEPDPADTPELSVRWEVDGELVALAGQKLAGHLLPAEAELRVEVVVRSGGMRSEMQEIRRTSLTNEPVSIEPSPARPDESIRCDLVAGLLDEPVESYNVEWLLNGAAWIGPTQSTVVPGDTISSEHTATGQRWLCRAVLAGTGQVTTSDASMVAPAFADLGPDSGFSDGRLGYDTRSRACVAADFTGDGRLDVYVGSPGDTSYLLANRSEDGVLDFELHQVLQEGHFSWGAAAADHDNDGDLDLFIAGGGNETEAVDILYRNDGGSFTDVTAQAGVHGLPRGDGQPPYPMMSGNAVWADVDADGHVDLFVNGNSPSDEMLGTGESGDLETTKMHGRHALWQNQGDGRFVEIAGAVGLDSQRPTRHSTFFDADNDGDLDLYENNFEDRNILWRNELAESGELRFTDVTDSWSNPEEDLGLPWDSFASTTTDVNHDGWLDLFVFAKGRDADGRADTQGPYADGHALFLNTGASGTPGFSNVAATARLNQRLEAELGVMGCQVADIDGNSIPDVYIGNGGPPAGFQDFLLVADGWEELHIAGLDLRVPRYADWSDLVDMPVEPREGMDEPPYPYRTHGTCIADFSGDGLVEIAVVNGGPGRGDEDVREPNRMFSPQWEESAPPVLVVRLEGDGRTVSRDAIGSRLELEVRFTDGTMGSLHGVILGGSAFSAQNGLAWTFGLREVSEVGTLSISWPDGSRSEVEAPSAPADGPLVVRHPGR